MMTLWPSIKQEFGCEKEENQSIIAPTRKHFYSRCTTGLICSNEWSVMFCFALRFVSCPFDRWITRGQFNQRYELIYSFTVQFLYKSNSNWIKLTSINIQICRFHRLNIQSRSLRHHEILATRAQFTWLAQRGPIEFSWFLNDPLPLVPPCFPHAMNYETGNSIHCQSENVGTLMTIRGPRSFRKEIHYERINHGHELLPRRFAPMCKTDAA